MSDWIHMLLGTLWSYLLVGAATAVLAKGWLAWRRRRLEAADDFDTPGVFAVLLAAGVFPVLWAASALVHRLEGSRGLLEVTCPPLAAFPGAEALLVVGAAAVLGWRAVWTPVRALIRDLRGDSEGGEGRTLSESDPTRAKLAAICRENVRLEPLADRIVAVTGVETACATRGLWRPRIEVRCEVVEDWDESELVGALLHEAAHLRARDPMHQTLIFLTRHWNPFGFLLSDERAAWRYARELQCDASAVASGADPLSLASALVSAARPTSPCERPHSVALDGCDVSAIGTRVQILLGYAEEAPRFRTGELEGTGRRWWMLLGVLGLVALVLPHAVDAWPMPLHMLF